MGREERWVIGRARAARAKGKMETKVMNRVHQTKNKGGSRRINMTTIV